MNTTTDNAPATETGAALRKMLADRERVEESKFHYSEKYRNLRDSFDALISKARQQAFSEGRKQGLKEMYDSVAYNFNVNQFAGEETLRLRQEYSAK